MEVFNTMNSITWRAVYRNGKIFPQYNKNGTTNKYGDIDREQLEYFDLVSSALPVGKNLIFRLHLEPGRKLIARERTIGNLMNPSDRKEVWMVGWQWNANGRNVQDIAWVFDDGHVELTGRFKEMPFGAPGKLMDCEEKLIGEK